MCHLTRTFDRRESVIHSSKDEDDEESGYSKIGRVRLECCPVWKVPAVDPLSIQTPLEADMRVEDAHCSTQVTKLSLEGRYRTLLHVSIAEVAAMFWMNTNTNAIFSSALILYDVRSSHLPL